MYTIGIDLGGTNIAVGICNEDLKIIDKASVPTLSKRPIEQIVADMAALCKKLAERNSISMDKIDRIGIAVPGTINSARGIVEYSNNIVMKNTPIVELFKKHIDKEVLVTNDANAAALGEALAGSGKGKKSLVMVTLGTGVGGGIIIDGRIFEGGVNTAGGEIGHTVIVSGGRQCTCGRRGCWEAYSSASALSAITAEKMRELELKGIPSLLFDEKEKEGRISARTAFSAMKRGDARELAVHLIYGREFTGEEPQQVVTTRLNKEYYATLSDENEVYSERPIKAQVNYLDIVVSGVANRQEDLNEQIQKYSIGWDVKRISRLARSVMQLAMFEILYLDDVPTGVAISEAVRIAKKYDGDDTGAFVNGILGAFARGLNAPAQPAEEA